MHKDFKEIPLNYFICEWVSLITVSLTKLKEHVKVCSQPCDKKIKLNFDGSSFGNLEFSCFGCVARDSEVNVFFVVCGRCRDGPIQLSRSG